LSGEKCKIRGLTGGIVGKKTTFEIILDQENQDGLINVTILGPENIIPLITQVTRGTYSVTYKVRVSGIYYVSITVNEEMVEGFPFTVIYQASPVAKAENTTAKGPALIRCVAGLSATFYVELRDKYNNIIQTSNNKIYDINVQIVDKLNNVIPHSIIPKDNGLYSVSYTAFVAVPCRVSVLLSGVHIHGSPFTCNVEPARANVKHTITQGSALTNGYIDFTNAFIIQTRDRYDNPLISGGEKLELQLKGTDKYMTKIVDKQNGSYIALYKVDKPGDYILSILHQKQPITGSPFTVKITTPTPSQIEQIKKQQLSILEDISSLDKPVTAAISQVEKPSSSLTADKNSQPSISPRAEVGLIITEAEPDKNNTLRRPVPNSSAPNSNRPLPPPRNRGLSGGNTPPPPVSPRRASVNQTFNAVRPVRSNSGESTLPIPPPRNIVVESKCSNRSLDDIFSKFDGDLSFLLTPAPLPPTSISIESGIHITKIQAHIRRWNAELWETMMHKQILVAKEILTTEISFVDSLHIIESVFHEPLKSIALTSRDLDEGKLQIIFANVGMVISVNSELLNNFKHCITATSVNLEQLADAFINSAPNMQYTYTRYVNNYDQAIKTLTWAQEYSPDFTEFITKQQSNNVQGYLTLPFYLIMPIQRLPKYELLLKELLKVTPEYDHNYSHLNEALEAMVGVTREINERKRGVETTTKIAEVQANVSGLPKGIFQGNHEYITEGEWRCRMGKNGKEKIRKIFLFWQFLFVCKRKSSHGKTTLKFYSLVTLTGSIIDPINLNPGSALKIVAPKYLVTIILDNDSQRQSLLSHLHKASSKKIS